MPKAKKKAEWRNRVVGFVQKPANQFTANALNFRRHPTKQRETFRGVITEIGFAGAVLENVRTGNLLDGHLRIEEALSHDENQLIPCVQVDLSEAEEKLLLATYDPISAMAATDREVLDMLLREVQTGDVAVLEMLADSAADVELYKTISSGGNSQIDSAYFETQEMENNEGNQTRCATCGQKLRPKR